MLGPSRSALPILALAVLVVTPSAGAAEEGPALGKPFQEAVGEVASRCAKAEATKLLVVVRVEAGLDDVPEELPATIFESLRNGLTEKLPDLDVQPCPLDEDSPLERESKRVLTARELRDLADAHEIDVVLDAAYRKSRGKPSLRLALFEQQRRLFLKHVPLGDDDVQQAVARHRARRPPSVAGRPNDPRPPRRGANTNAGRNVAASDPSGRPIRPGGPAQPGPGPGGEGSSPGLPDDVPPGDATGLNKRVLEFAQRNFGQRVGNGECWTLANEALKAAGARPAAGYTFGRGIDRTLATPGDVLQFKSVRLERGGRYWNLGTPHHTAVVEGVEGDVVTVLHQNFGSRTVTRFTFDFGDMVRGGVRAFRPRP